MGDTSAGAISAHRKDGVLLPRFHGPGTTLEFRDDSLVAIVGRFGRRHATDDPRWASFSVPSLFARVNESIRDLQTWVGKLEFDPTYGVPIVLETDVLDAMTDGWFHLYSTHFRAIPR